MSEAERLWTVEELARFLGVPVATVYQWRYRRQGPPGIRVGRHLRFRRADIERWLSERLSVSGVRATLGRSG